MAPTLTSIEPPPQAGQIVTQFSVHVRATDVIAVEQARAVDEPWDSDDFVDRIVLLQRQRQAQVPARLP